ncbi:unnamed protein product [Rhizophagus irregularis]|nr:unnamed protein product [Rhizophagus irregularis]
MIDALICSRDKNPYIGINNPKDLVCNILIACNDFQVEFFLPVKMITLKISNHSRSQISTPVITDIINKIQYAFNY